MKLIFSQYPHAPPYASSVLFELYNQNGKYYIQIFYKNTTDETIPPLYIPSCGLKCPLDKFQSIYATIIPLKEFEFECRLSLLSMTYEEANLNPYETGMYTFEATNQMKFLILNLF